MTLRQLLAEMHAVRTRHEYLEHLERITEQYPNSVRLLAEPDPEANYTCYAYALGLTGEPTYEAIRRLNQNDAWACSRFVEWLFKHRPPALLAPEDARDGDLVWYRGDGRFQHVGVLGEAGRVRSKFGLGGFLFEHDLWAVPQQYGTELWYSHPVPAGEVLEWFLEYAKERGIELEPGGQERDDS